jgi:membrane fusion protein (multidrug efflux system)
MQRNLFLTLLILMLLPSCGKKTEDANAKKPNVPLITVTQAEKINLEIREQSIGTVEGLIDPTIGAEVAGRVTALLARPGQTVRKGQALLNLDATDLTLQKAEAQAEVTRLEALLSNQEKVLERNQILVKKQFISQNALDDVTTQKAALEQQLAGARAKIAIIEHNRNKTSIYSPIDGVIEKQIVSVGDYVKVGDPLMQVIGRQKLRVYLPVPERIASQIHIGLSVRLSTPTTSEIQMGKINELKPLINTDSRALNAVVDIQPDAGWQPGASVTGSIILGQRDDAVMVPEQSVVLRPAGEVVYVIKDNKAEQRIVKTGLLQDGKVEIREGLQAGETVAVDGAAMLTKEAKVSIKPLQKN